MLLPIKIDLHVHTCYSHDCSTTIKELFLNAKKNGLDGFAVTDHNTIKGALRAVQEKNDNLLVIPGIEVSSAQGHILGINIKTHIPQGLRIEETVEKIHEAGGIAVAAHPSAIYKNSLGLFGNLSSYGFDAVEVLNSQAFPFFLLKYLNKRFAEQASLPQTGGSDSHLPETIGLAYTIIYVDENHCNIEEIIKAIKNNMTAPFGKATPWRLRLRKTLRG